ncbi:MAG: winged helix-turn-helix transcriptional regulator [Hyphomicrobiales bacterium]|nr:winged helix-turn-helix transcriptional regulator [Hyphomicrobiales bacterium]MCP5370904.1 winged helix-turn-helix transcriptional regulator [Hyphomicrobiales bacterium]
MNDVETLQANAARASGLLRLLSNPIRFKVLCRLSDGEHSVADLARSTGTKQSCLSQHLAKLRKAGVVATRRSGHRILYSRSGHEAERVLDVLAHWHGPLPGGAD